MTIEQIASAVYNNTVTGLAGITSNPKISVEQLQDEVVAERNQIMREFLLKGILTLDELLTRYNLNYKDKGLTKFFDKLSEVDKRTILIDSLKNNILANKTSLYLDLYKASKHGVKKNKKASTKNKVKKNKKK